MYKELNEYNVQNELNMQWYVHGRKIFLFCFAKILRMRNMAILYKETKWDNPKCACVQMYYFHACFFDLN